MKIKRESRVLWLSELPDKVEGITTPEAFEIEVHYTGDGSNRKAIALDNLVLPVLTAAPEALDALEALVSWMQVALNVHAFDECALPSAAQAAQDRAHALLASVPRCRK